MRLSQVAAQLYTLHGLTKTREQIETALARVRAIGYEAVQASGLGPFETPLPDADLAAMMRDAGLTVCATHEPGDVILNQPKAVAARLDALGCNYTAYPHPGGVDMSSLDAVHDLAKRLEQSGRVLADHGKILCYHNHQIEFRRLGGKTILEILFERTDPVALQGELDTYWVQNGGGDPVAWCERLPGRLPLLHLKDYQIDMDNKPQYADIGVGNLDFPRIVAAAEKAGCEWFIVERDPMPGDPFESLRASFEHIRDHLVT